MGDAGPKTKPQKRGNSSPWMPRLRRRGEKLLHSKYVVILVIILTIADCSLVIAELILDLYSVKKTLSATEDQTFKFIRSIRSQYPEEVRSNDTVFSLFDRVTHATILWNNSKQLDFHLRCQHLNAESTTSSNARMTFPYLSSSVPLRKNNNEPLDYYTQTVIIQNGKNAGAPSLRHRREHKSNIVFGQRYSYPDNEMWIKKITTDFFRRYFRRVRRYLPTSIKSMNDNIFNERDATYQDETYRNTNNDNESINETNRILNDLLLLHRQLSHYFDMQESKPISSDDDTTISSVISKRNNAYDKTYILDVGDTGFQSDGISYDSESDQNDVGIDAFGGSLYSNMISSDYTKENSEYDSGVLEDGVVDKEVKTESPASRSKRDYDDEEAFMRKELHHSKEMEVAHKLHYASVCVVSILVIEVTMKIVCAGSHFLKRKIEVFDAVVIVTSVVVDLIFIKGLSEFAVDDSIFVLAILLPWRVIRVVNSLVMAVIDHEHVKLRLLYSRKKKLDKTVENLRNEVDELKGLLQDIRSFCIKEGIDSSKIDGMLGKFAPRRRKDSKFYTLVKLVMSTASINNNDNDSVSSSSIENDLRHYSNRDSVLNEAASTDGTIASIKGYLSVPFSNGDSRSASEAESVIVDTANNSPSIYITSPASDDGMFAFCDIEMGDNDVFARHETPDCIEEEDCAATIDVTSTTSIPYTNNNVAFYVGSQTSFNTGFFQDNVALEENDKVHNDSLQGLSFGGALRDTASISSVDTNKNIYGHYFGQYLTVPNCTVSVSSGTNTISISSNNNDAITVDGCISTNSDTSTPLPQGFNSYEMRRSTSEYTNVTLGTSPYEGVFRRVLYGSPIPARRLPEIRTRRKTYTRYSSESDDSDSIGLLKRDSKGRLRRNSGDPQSSSVTRIEQNKRARSHSPSPMTLLSVPVNNKMESAITCSSSAITCSSSRSMNDVSFSGNPCSHKFGEDGRILRRSCLSLNSEGRKRRGKSPHRVSFKVS